MSLPTLLALAAFFLSGAIAGLALRPAAGRLVEAIGTSQEIDPLPLFPALWASMAGQYRMLDATDAGPKIVYLGDSITDWMKPDEMLTFNKGRALNGSVSGDTTLGILRRSQEGSS